MDERSLVAIRMKIEGKTYAEIGKVLGLSRQRIQQITSPPIEAKRAARERAKGLCEDCGMEVARPVYHHVRTIGQEPANYNLASNLAHLCSRCHFLPKRWFEHWAEPRKQVYFPDQFIVESERNRNQSEG